MEPYNVVEQMQDETDVPVMHRLWKVDASENRFFEEEFKQVRSTYVADGHHRSAAAYNVGKMQMERAKAEGKAITGDEDFNYFMSIIYPSENLEILDYNRVIKSLNGLTAQQFMDRLSADFADLQLYPNQNDVRPKQKGSMSLLLDGQWYECTVKPEAVEKCVQEHGGSRAVSTLDV